MQQHLIHSKSV